MNRTKNSFIVILAFAFFFLGTCRGEYRLVWSDEFNGNSLDQNTWNIEVNCDGGGNNELQCYTNRPSNVNVTNGNLIISPKLETYNGKSYTSGRINSKKSVAWKYGRFEIRAKVPRGIYLWPAIWMMPRDSVYGTWAASGEIDIMEARGQANKVTESTIHYGGQWPNNRYQGSGPTTFDSDFSLDFHVYSMLWEEDKMTFMVDGVSFHTEDLNRNWWSGSGSNPYTANRQPFDQPFYIVMNCAIGGGFFGTDSNSLTTQMAQGWENPYLTVDWVRVYQDSNGTSFNNTSSSSPTSFNSISNVSELLQSKTQGLVNSEGSLNSIFNFSLLFFVLLMLFR